MRCSAQRNDRIMAWHIGLSSGSSPLSAIVWRTRASADIGLLASRNAVRTRRDISPLANKPDRPRAGRLSLICCGMASGSNNRSVASIWARSARAWRVRSSSSAIVPPTSPRFATRAYITGDCAMSGRWHIRVADQSAAFGVCAIIPRRYKTREGLISRLSQRRRQLIRGEAGRIPPAAKAEAATLFHPTAQATPRPASSFRKLAGVRWDHRKGFSAPTALDR